LRDTQSKLPGKQEAALAALLAHPTVRDAARAANVAEGTIWRYLSDPTFSEHYKKARRQVTEHLIARLTSDSTKAARVLLEVAEDTNAPASARVSAARTIIEQALKGAELRDLMERIDALEATQKGKR
jgi:DNA-binding MurR/RpiR family transcriptional regulator